MEQAILECVKNAYDADSLSCAIEIMTDEVGTRVETAPAERLAGYDTPAEGVSVSLTEPDDDGQVTRTLTYKGRITIADKGDGLTEADLKGSWLVISKSRKRGAPGAPKRKTRLGRTPLGDKGLGRLGTMKLGDILLVETAVAKDAPKSTAQFRWADCEVAETIDRIPVTLDTVPNDDGLEGTRVSVLGLHDAGEWARATKVDELTRSLARLISPFEGTSNFPVTVSLNTNSRSLAAATKELLKRAVAEFEFEWRDAGDGKRELFTKAMFRKELLASQRSGRIERTKLVFDGPDKGAGFENYLRHKGRMKNYGTPEIEPKGQWYIQLERTFQWSDILLTDAAAMSDPGPFKGRFYFFHLDAFDTVAPPDAVLGGVSVDRAFVKSMTGISILRDGFRVRSPGDWLGLSAEMTSGSTYGLRADNTIGYVALTGEHNHALVEKSDREGFVEDATYRGFLEIARRARKYSSEAMGAVRRSVDEYGKTLEAPKDKSPRTGEDAIRVIERDVASKRDAQGVMDDAISTVRQQLQVVERLGGKADPETVRAMQSAMRAVETVKGKLDVATADEMTVARLRHEFEDRQDQAIALFESAAVGLSARGLAHELRTHLTEIRTRATAMHAAAEKGATGPALMPHLRAIRGACSAIQGAASLIDPMLPRSRAARETFSVAAFAKEYVANREISFKQAGIEVSVVDGSGGAVIRANRPRMLQVLDNIVRNATYWLRRGRATGMTSRAMAIAIEVDPTGFVVSDTGPGVDVHVEESLFEIFVSNKPDKDGGQGIGLFIVGQLLGLDGCGITLLEDRNADGRRYRFAVDLSPVTLAA
ncbi:ATP-binding protein [Methylobacterium indicum]|uniref:ATP-binding protein n=1 Tax=Methylobacterium indicum TaxID=1775910 RepID=UPI001FCD5A66|nr:ATP-binding protein [Methylobacterium indicum]